MELNSGNLGSQCEAVIAVLQGLMSSEVELVPGGVTGDVTGLELAKVCQQSHVSVTGRNSGQLHMGTVIHCHTDNTIVLYTYNTIVLYTYNTIVLYTYN